VSNISALDAILRSMNKTINSLPKLFHTMLENYNLCKKTRPSGYTSTFWDVFPEDYEKSIGQTSAWTTFLRNPLSLGFNDVLINFDNARYVSQDKKYDGIDAWKNRKEHDFTNLIDEVISSPEEQKTMFETVDFLFKVCGPDFIKNYSLESKIGSPQKSVVNLGSESFHTNMHDLSLLYYFWQISRTADVLLETDTPVIAEIGAGYGGLISKAKKRYPKARFIIFDLPEPGAIQAYYIQNTYPDSKILYLKDLLERGNKVFNEKFDFMILPGWMIDKVPDKYIDLMINIRSMMEMSPPIIDFYFTHIHRVVKDNGLFACFNRYIKVYEDGDIIMKDYPFDEYWVTVLSQTSLFQNHIHDLILKRQDKKSDLHIRDILKSLPPH
jgi:putative sugar O-methyltransferase